MQGESNVTEAQALEVVKFLIELGVDPKAAVSNGENAHLRRRVSRLELGRAAAGRPWHRRERDQQIGHDAVARGLRVRAIGSAACFSTHETAALLVKLGADPTLGKPCMAQNTMSVRP